MSQTRRDFIRHTSAVAAALSVPTRATAVASLPAHLDGQGGVSLRELCLLALDAARTAGASYADVRIVNTRTQFVSAHESRVTSLSDTETFGVGVRALVSGAWGFTAGRRLTRQECQRVAVEAVEKARANVRGLRTPVELAPVDAYPDGAWRSPIRKDPFRVSMGEKADLLLSANAEALKVAGAQFVNSSMLFTRQQTTFASTEGSIIEQTAYRSVPSMTVTAVATDFSDFQSRSSTEIAPMGLGYEHVERADFVGRAGEWAEEAVAKLSAVSVEPGQYDLVIDPTNLFLTVHECIGHPTELDRALGYEADYAGTSFVAPPKDVIGKLRYGPEFMNVLGDRNQEGALATVGWDDEGVPADSWPIVKDGIFVDYQTTREQVSWVSDLTEITTSHGCSDAQSWDNVQLQRMPNVSLMPGEEDFVIADLIAATDRGILVKGRGSYSIDQQRYNFEFGGQVFYEIVAGKVGRMLRDVAYQGNTLDFWNSMDMLGGPRSYFLGGTVADSKGQPAQAGAVSHGCPPARFKQFKVINTVR
jgi:TldD protein